MWVSVRSDSLPEGSEFELTVPVSKLALPAERAVYPSFSSAALFDVGSCAAKRLVSSAPKAVRGERLKQIRPASLHCSCRCGRPRVTCLEACPRAMTEKAGASLRRRSSGR
jgi:hypothetical protein